jgi:hypothetical protein
MTTRADKFELFLHHQKDFEHYLKHKDEIDEYLRHKTTETRKHNETQKRKHNEEIERNTRMKIEDYSNDMISTFRITKSEFPLEDEDWDDLVDFIKLLCLRNKQSIGKVLSVEGITDNPILLCLEWEVDYERIDEGFDPVLDVTPRRWTGQILVLACLIKTDKKRKMWAWKNHPNASYNVDTTEFNESTGFDNIPVRISMISYFKDGIPINQMTTLILKDKHKKQPQIIFKELNHEEDDVSQFDTFGGAHTPRSPQSP